VLPPLFALEPDADPLLEFEPDALLSPTMRT
jgi:hypothetical protein